MGRLIAALALVPALVPAADRAALFQPGKLRVLILSGRNNHDWRATTPALRDALVRTGRFDVRVAEEPAGLTAETLAVYDAIVSDYNGPRLGPAAEQAIEGFVKGGKGLVVLHAASYAFGRMEILGDRHVRMKMFEEPWKAWGDMVGALWSAEDPRTGHGDRHSFQVTFDDRAHPIAQGMPESFWANDELYHNFRMTAPVKVLASAFDDPKRRGNGKREPLLWTREYGKGRVFHSALGHDTAAMQEAGYLATFTRGTEWAATGAVTLPPDAGSPKPDPGRIKVELITGGHDFDPSLYTVFEGHSDLRVNVWPHPNAYRGDLRKRADVIVMYDMIASIEEPKRQALQRYVENGGGVVVLHHAVANFQDWPWWWKEVTGVRYVLKEEPGYKPSSYKHDVELWVEPAAKHPVLQGIPPMHITDETYKNMWISDAAEPLLKVNEPTSDGAVAWIAPWRKSRVVVIQLGHDRLAHEHPMFRQLVRNAILWASGKN